MKIVPALVVRATVGLAVLSFSGCGHNLPELPDFDSAAWRADPYGCRNQRAALLPVLARHRNDLFEARINDITAVLGHPDEEELGEQSDKVYIYYVTPGPQCGPGHPRAARNRVMLRSGATGTVTEVILPVLAEQ
ncbi:hypothetical protein [Hymenobacter rubripertinctus]|uniref:Uncharacterized protein n=1 Tax=Hymenobacter rubripertinctus TaxID=2029981 RepID=A0A418R8Y9_9BACT|nr:hypothetical protein [Hymenobacter rubripertinctus]RIY13876.1 hypothetical protein D0T11_01995 [Hymenobacter rubripertinctus]